MGLRFIEVLVVFFLTMNLFSGMLISTGAAASIGLENQVETGGSEDADSVEEASEEVSTGAPTGETLFGMYNVLADKIGQLRAIVFGGPTMLANAGVPRFLTAPMEAIIAVVYAVGLIKFLRGIS